MPLTLGSPFLRPRGEGRGTERNPHCHSLSVILRASMRPRRTNAHDHGVVPPRLPLSIAMTRGRGPVFVQAGKGPRVREGGEGAPCSCKRGRGPVFVQAGKGPRARCRRGRGV